MRCMAYYLQFVGFRRSQQGCIYLVKAGMTKSSFFVLILLVVIILVIVVDIIVVVIFVIIVVIRVRSQLERRHAAHAQIRSAVLADERIAFVQLFLIDIDLRSTKWTIDHVRSPPVRICS